MIRIALLDDALHIALQSADWGSLPSHAEVRVFHDHLDGEDAVAERLREFDVVMALRERTPFPRSLLERLPRLKLIANASKYNAAIDFGACTELGIPISGTANTGRSAMELAFALMLSLLREVPRQHQALRAGAWRQSVGEALNGKTLGILGLGYIGGQVAQVGRAFEMEPIAWSHNLTAERAAECGARRVSFEELLSGADVLTLHTRLSDRTRGLIGAAELARMKPGAYLINTARGPIVQEQALVEALRQGRIAGAGLDVFDTEPLPAGHPFTTLDNVVLLPHLGGITTDRYRMYYGESLDNILAFLQGEPQRVLNPEVLPRRRPLEA